MARVEKNVFISYRRTDISWALAVYQYLASQKGENYYQGSPQSSPQGPLSGLDRVQPGGSWDIYNADVRSTSRDWADPELMDRYVGFRCAMDAE